MNFKYRVVILVLAAMLGGVSSATAKETAESQEAKTDSKSASKPAEIARISVDELKEMIAKNAPVTIIDARSAGSYDSSTTKIKGAIRMPTDEVPSRLKELSRDREIVTYCA